MSARTIEVGGMTIIGQAGQSKTPAVAGRCPAAGDGGDHGRRELRSAAVGWGVYPATTLFPNTPIRRCGQDAKDQSLVH